MPLRSIESDFWSARRSDDEQLLNMLVESADGILDVVRVVCSHLDCPSTEVGVPGFLPDLSAVGAYIVDEQIGGGRLIARQPDVAVHLAGVGAEVGGNLPDWVLTFVTETHAVGSMGSRGKRLLRILGRAFRLLSPEEKILSVIFGLDGTLTPAHESSEALKKLIEQLLPGSAGQDFRDLYKVRNKLVHHGKMYDDLGRNPNDDLRRLQVLVYRILEVLAAERAMRFEEFWPKPTGSM